MTFDAKRCRPVAIAALKVPDHPGIACVNAELIEHVLVHPCIWLQNADCEAEGISVQVRES